MDDLPEFDSPCLMFPLSNGTSWKIFRSTYNDLYELEFPELSDAGIVYSKDGWLLMSSETDLFFFNPLTKVKYQLPPTPTSPCDIELLCFTSPPTFPSDCFVFGVFWTTSTRQVCKFGLIKLGDDEWKSGFLDDDFQPSNCPPLFHNGKFLCLERNPRNIGIFDPNGDDESRWVRLVVGREQEDREEEGYKQERVVIHESHISKGITGFFGGLGIIRGKKRARNIISYMVQVEGDILGVFVTSPSGTQVRVEKLDLSEMRWSKIESLGDKILYLSRRGSFVDSKEEGNKIYFNQLYNRAIGVAYSLDS